MMMHFAVEKHFSKKFTFEAPEQGWSLPAPDTMFTEKPFQSVLLGRLKRQLNEVKAQLNDYVLGDWHRHTNTTNPAGRVLWTVKETASPELLTQAWCKLYEVLCSFNVVPPSKVLRSLHLCEAPGAFVSALNHFLRLQHPACQWSWLASTLNPHYEGNPGTLMVADDRLISLTPEHWLFGEDGTGDLLLQQNARSLLDQVAGHGVHLVSADGSIDCQEDPGEQESLVAPLLWAEVVTAIHALASGGSLVLKCFTMLEGSSVCLLYLLASCFNRLHIFKPGTSKEGNSELYVVALGLRDKRALQPHLLLLWQNYERAQQDSMSMFRESDLPSSFMQQVEQAATVFYTWQVEAILHNIDLFEHGIGQAKRRRLNQLRQAVAASYVSRYELQPIAAEVCLVAQGALSAAWSPHLESRTGDTSHVRQAAERNALQQAGSLSRAEAAELLLSRLPHLQQLAAEHQQSTPMQVEDRVACKLEVGRGFSRLCNSKFCRPWLLRLHHACRDIQRGLVDATSAAGTSLDDSGHLGDTSVDASGYLSEWLPSLMCRLQGLAEGGDLELRGLYLMSCVPVGCVRLLAASFQQVSLNVMCGGGVHVTFAGYLGHSAELDAFLAEVRDTRLSPGSAILSLAPLPLLCRGVFYQRVVQANHAVVHLAVVETLKMLGVDTAA